MTIPKFPHAQSVEALSKEMEVSKEGYSHQKAKELLSHYGLNILQEKQHNLFKLFLEQFKSPLVYILLIAASLSLLMGNIHEGITAILAFWQGRENAEIIYLVIAELVSAVPEGLPIVVTLVLTIGAMTLSRKKFYIRHLPSVETLGSATVIASDKTGTITRGKLHVEELLSLNDNFSKTISALANESIDGKGDPLDTALALESDNIEEWEIELVGLVGFLDPPKEGVLEAVKTAKKAGLRIIMITGDNALTATAIAKSVNIFKEGDEVLNGRDLDKLDDETLKGCFLK